MRIPLLKMAVVEMQAALRKRNTLITELCEALESELPPKGSIYTAERAGALIAKRSLLQRAREATR